MTYPQTQLATLGGGCFWCLEAAYQEVAGVVAVTSGYAGGTQPDPAYYQVTAGSIGHAEVVQIEFDPMVITFTDILEIFWALHDPTTLNRQGSDIGSQYRSIILYHDETQKAEAERSTAAAQELWSDPIVTELAPLYRFWPAEKEHRNYFRQHPGQAYCQIVINPKLQKLRQKFAARLKRSF